MSIHWAKVAAIIISLIFIIVTLISAQPPEVPEAKQIYICQPCGCDCDDKTYDQAGNCPCCNMTLTLKSAIKKVAVLVFDGVELLDFSGPLDVFLASAGYFDVYTVSPDSLSIITGHGTLEVNANYRIDNCPPPDILVVPGGGVGEVMRNERVLNYIKATAADAELVLSVCSGSFILASAGLLDGLKATAHESDVDELENYAKNTTVVRGQRYVDNGKIISAGGVTSGIDAALYIIERLHGNELAEVAARYLQHQRRVQ